MKYWVLGTDDSPSSITLKDGLLSLSNSYFMRNSLTDRGIQSLTNHRLNKNLINQPGEDIRLSVNNREISIYKDCRFMGMSEISMIEDVPWKKYFHRSHDFPYPARGSAASLLYSNDELDIRIIYEIFDDMPVYCKRVHIRNKSEKPILITHYSPERLAVGEMNQDMVYMETDYTGGEGTNNAHRLLSSQKNREELFTAFDAGPDVELAAGETFKGFRSYVLLHSVIPYEQRMIEYKEMIRRLAPWTNEVPLIMHVTGDNMKRVRKVVDQCDAVGFDTVVQSFTFGPFPGVNQEKESTRYYKKHKKTYDYAGKKGIKIGGYTLAIVQNYKAVRHPWAKDGKGSGSIFRCLCTDWSRRYWNKIVRFQKETGARIIEIDGPYHFYTCEGGETHNHRGLKDSRYMQWKESTVEAFGRLKNEGVYINTPDWLFLSGSNRSGIGYEEIAFSQPRQEQLIAARIYGYKGSFKKYGSMAWGFLPIDQYHGGGKEAKFAPLSKNLFDYEWAVAQAMISGIIPCFRGKNLYDSNECRLMMQKWVRFYRKYNKVLNGTTIHFLPPVIDREKPSRTTEIDGILNLQSQGDCRGILGLFNQTDRDISRTIRIPVYYTGLTGLDHPPNPPGGCGITEVEHPVYGEYPPIYPVKPSESDSGRSGYPGWDGELLAIEQINEDYTSIDQLKETVPPGTSLILSERDCQPESHEITPRGDIELTIHMKAMSYTWYALRQGNSK